jgi:RES domain
MDALLSFNIADYFHLYENEIYRIVEGQHFIATRKLVDSDEEQRVLEKILDQSKPPVATYNSRGELHYLLYTPFRYPPLKSGGRFHTRIEQSIFYGAEDLKTAMAEIAYRRFEFMRHSSGVFQPMHVAHAHFTVLVKSATAVLLTNIPFVQYRGNVSHPSSYSTSLWVHP